MPKTSAGCCFRLYFDFLLWVGSTSDKEKARILSFFTNGSEITLLNMFNSLIFLIQNKYIIHCWS